MRINDRDLQLALEHVSALQGGNLLDERQNLRGQIERRNVEISQSLLTLFGDVQSELTDVERTVGDMRRTCSELDARLQRTKELSGKLIQQTDGLAKQHETLQAERVVASQFLARFQLTEAELDALKASELRAPFFDALERVRAVHNDVSVNMQMGGGGLGCSGDV